MYIWWVGSWRDGLRNSPALDPVLWPGILGLMSEHKLLTLIPNVLLLVTTSLSPSPEPRKSVILKGFGVKICTWLRHGVAINGDCTPVDYTNSCLHVRDKRV